MKKLLMLSLGCILFMMSTGCGTIYKTAVDQRNVQTVATDEYITAEITSGFLNDDLVKVLDIGANVYLGHVYLFGEYESEAQKERAISIAGKVKGVTGVTYYLLPKDPGDVCGTSDNLLIRGKLNKALISDDRIWSTNVDVAVVRCNVVLMGLVGTQQEIDLSIDYAKKTEGVRRVKSYLKIKAK